MSSDWFMAYDDGGDGEEFAPHAGSYGPPEDQLPGVVPVEVVIGRTADVAVLLTGLRAFPSGVAMVLSVRLREGRLHDGVLRPWDDVFDHGPEAASRDAQWQEARLRWGFTFASGISVDSLGLRPLGPCLRGLGGSGSDLGCDRDYWLSGLPPAGPVEVFCTWPRAGLPRTVSTLDAQPVLDAAARARPLWPGTGVARSS